MSALMCALSLGGAQAQQQMTETKKLSQQLKADIEPKENCRNISAEIRPGAPLTREVVIAELVRARAEGEMDFQISTTPPAIYRPLCELPLPEHLPTQSPTSR